MDTLKVSVPAFCFTLQNNLQFVAASHLVTLLLTPLLTLLLTLLQPLS